MSDEQDRQRERDEQNWQRTRETIHDCAKRGEITGEEADAEAEKLGPAPLSKRPGRFSTTPDPAEFRPERMPKWTLAMALAWILFGDLDEVMEWNDAYLRECLRWVPCGAGREVKQPHAPTIVLLRISVAEGRVGANGSKASMSGLKAEKQLLGMLQEGKLKATGIDTTTTERRVKIPAREWHELVPVGLDKDEVRRGLLGEGYRKVLVPSALFLTETRNGLPGRPVLAAHPIEPEFEGRSATGQVADSRTQQKTDPKASSRSRGRGKGGGSYERLDEPLILRGIEMYNVGEVASPEAAAKKLANEAYGSGTPESKTRRLADRIRRKIAK